MASHLKISAGQYSDKGRKAVNQDFLGLRIPEEPLLTSKGIAIALADGISSSDVSHLASQTAVAARTSRMPSDRRDSPVLARPVEPRGDTVPGRPRTASRT